MKTISELREEVANFKEDQNSYVAPDRALIKLADLVAEILDHMERIESTANHANNIASCLANGIQPD